MKVKLKSFQKTIAATGTPEALVKTDIPASFVRVKALSTNNGLVFIGDETGQQYELAPGIELPLNEIKAGIDEVNLKEIYVRAATNGNGVSVIYGDKNK